MGSGILDLYRLIEDDLGYASGGPNERGPSCNSTLAPEIVMSIFEYIHLEGARPTLTSFHPFKATSSEPWSSQQRSREAHHARVDALELMPPMDYSCGGSFPYRIIQRKGSIQSPKGLPNSYWISRGTPKRRSICPQPARYLRSHFRNKLHRGNQIPILATSKEQSGAM